MSTIRPLATRHEAEGKSALEGLTRRLEGKQVPPFELQLLDGAVHHLGPTGAAPSFRLQVRTRDGLRAVGSLDELAVGEAYMNGDLDVEGDFLALFDLRPFLTDRHPAAALSRFLMPLFLGQVQSDKKWVPRHYDHGNDFYFSFLDQAYRLYSQALFKSSEETLEQAVLNKLEYIKEVCRLRPGSRVLDVGGGWGSFARYASERGIDVTMLTISHEQFRYLSDWCAAQSSPGRVNVVYENVLAYDAPEPYDAVVLLGVMEHLPDYAALFSRFDRLVRPNGYAYMDFSANRRKFHVSTFTYRHVFPGNHTPVVLPDLLAAANRSSFEPVAVHNDRHSYFLTLQSWARNLEAAHARIAPRFGERTYRLFQLYLWGGAHQLHREGRMESFRTVFQRSMGASSAAVGTYRAI